MDCACLRLAWLASSYPSLTISPQGVSSLESALWVYISYLEASLISVNCAHITSSGGSWPGCFRAINTYRIYSVKSFKKNINIMVIPPTTSQASNLTGSKMALIWSQIWERKVVVTSSGSILVELRIKILWKSYKVKFRNHWFQEHSTMYPSCCLAYVLFKTGYRVKKKELYQGPNSLWSSIVIFKVLHVVNQFVVIDLELQNENGN